jgi:hypothetical protein
MSTPLQDGANAAPALQPDVLDAALAPEIRDRLRHLFRDSLKKGRIHPLYLPMLRYRQSRVGA